ncbi:MAG: ParA family protein [Lachnospiraceae bacterium]|nr:ParA family protein [Lachnospiraceae bacterium]
MVISVMNKKGGVGKTTTSTTLASILAERGKKVLLIDYDGQGNATERMGVEKEHLKTTINDVLNKIILEEELPAKSEYIINLPDHKLDLIPANNELYALQNNLVNADYRELILKQLIDEIKNDYEYVIIDCLPTLGTVLKNAMVASDYIVLPVEPEVMAVEALPEIIKNINSIKKKGNPDLTIAGILITKAETRTNLEKATIDYLKELLGAEHNIFSSKIPTTVKIKEAQSFGLTINEYDKNSLATIAYNNFVDELLKYIGDKKR